VLFFNDARREMGVDRLRGCAQRPALCWGTSGSVSLDRLSPSDIWRIIARLRRGETVVVAATWRCETVLFAAADCQAAWRPNGLRVFLAV
jgi:hypothetical protein